MIKEWKDSNMSCIYSCTNLLLFFSMVYIILRSIGRSINNTGTAKDKGQRIAQVV